MKKLVLAPHGSSWLLLALLVRSPAQDFAPGGRTSEEYTHRPKRPHKGSIGPYTAPGLYKGYIGYTPVGINESS